MLVTNDYPMNESPPALCLGAPAPRQKVTPSDSYSSSTIFAALHISGITYVRVDQWQGPLGQQCHLHGLSGGVLGGV